jgi:DNA-binding beta-propeller fold protein YncE
MQRSFLLAVFLVLLVLAAGPNLLTTSANHSYQVVHGWPKLPEGFALGQTTGVEVNSKNQVVVFHRGARPIIVFEAESGKMIASFGDGLFGSAHGLTVDDNDNIWVTDGRRHTIHKFSPDGKLLMTVGAPDVPGLDGSHFNRPTDVAIAPNGDMYVADGYGNSMVHKFSPNGELVLSWGAPGGEPGQFTTPHGIWVDGESRVYVADRENNCVQVFDGDGNFITSWGNFYHPMDIWMDKHDIFYVTDQVPRFTVLDRDGNILARGRAPNAGHGIYGDSEGNLYLAASLRGIVKMARLQT